MKFKPFLITIIISALLIAATAALFSITGIASLFSGHFLSVALMAGALETGKLVVASFLYRYWDEINRLFKFYLILAVFILMGITSAGIFGYLSESYQKTKGDYTVIEKEANILESKKQVFIDRKLRLQNDKELEFNTKKSNQTRADSLTARGQSISRTRRDIKESETKISLIENQISAAEDSIGVYDLRVIELQSQNIKGELGPLKYIADAFGTDMDTTVKFFILILIFVFDPLAISLVIAANIVYSKRVGRKTEFTDVLSSFSKKKEQKNKKPSITEEEMKKLKDEYEQFTKANIEIVEEDDMEELKEEPMVENTPEEPKEEPVVETPPEEIKEEPKVETPPEEPKKKRKPKWHSANWRG